MSTEEYFDMEEALHLLNYGICVTHEDFKPGVYWKKSINDKCIWSFGQTGMAAHALVGHDLLNSKRWKKFEVPLIFFEALEKMEKNAIMVRQAYPTFPYKKGMTFSWDDVNAVDWVEFRAKEEEDE